MLNVDESGKILFTNYSSGYNSEKLNIYFYKHVRRRYTVSVCPCMIFNIYIFNSINQNLIIHLLIYKKIMYFVFLFKINNKC